MTATAGVLAARPGGPIGALEQAVRGRRAGLAGLVEAARDGDADAFAELVRRFEAPVYHQVLRMVRRRSVAEDLAQDVFISLWRHLGDVPAEEALGLWLRRVAINAVIDHWRKEDARRRKLEALRAHPLARRALGPAGRMESREAADAVQAALDHLPPHLRSVLVLRATEGLGYGELGRVLGISASAVRSRLFRARQEVARALARADAPIHLERMYRPRDAARGRP